MVFRLAQIAVVIGAICWNGTASGSPKQGGPLKLIVVGNSIVRHPPKESIGWTNDWGMAASSAEKDFAHLVAKGLSEQMGKPVEMRIGNNCGIEQTYKTSIDFQSALKSDLDWKPDYVVVGLGENLKPFVSADDQKSWEDSLYCFGHTYQERNPDVRIVFRSVFWQDPVRNKLIASAARRLGAGYADIGGIGNDRSYQAQGLFWHGGVACHPNDKAMAVMAEIVLRELQRLESQEKAPVKEVRSESTAKPWLIRKNENWICEYSDSIRARPQLKGMMIHSRGVNESDCRDLQTWGVRLVRLPILLPQTSDCETRDHALNKWLDEFKRTQLPRLNQYCLSVVLSCFSFPGGKESSGDYKFYSDENLFDQFRKEWKLIAKELIGRSGIAGYDLCNEPHQSHASSVVDYWEAQRIVAEDIRRLDGETPIIVEAYGWDGPEAFAAMSPMKLKNIIYQVHMYYPLPYTHQGLYDWKRKCVYPSSEEGWNRNYLMQTLSKVRAFELRHQARIYCGEFSAVSWAEGAADYIRDCGEILNEYGWDWTYHAFREFPGWSVEHEGSGKDSCYPVNSTARKQVLLELLK